MILAKNLKNEIKKSVTIAINEDIGDGDLTSSITENIKVSAVILTREDMTLSGQAWANEVFNQIDPKIKIEWMFNDGDTIKKNKTLAIINGKRNSIVMAERCVLNFLQTLSSTATQTRRYVDAVNGTKCKILDTRKTIPGLRLAQKYAVSCGGGKNHRFGLFDAILLKENHITNSSSINELVKIGRIKYPNILIEVEVETIKQLKEAIKSGADRILLDNFNQEMLQEACRINSLSKNSTELEASGNITIENIKNIAKTGVDFISVGAITKNIKSIDLSMLIDSW
ncbi:MAG: carboxylating nicotinate-nucleotide diphosphorylase [Gammaproteobacteria bacterium]|nr:MAG: carboxylating nicotinate-nucleotide diphosphorylase [Gammaproteobacteria bacterium]